MSDRTPEILTLEDTPGNRGLLESMTRFGTQLERETAHRRLVAWKKTDPPRPMEKAGPGLSGGAAGKAEAERRFGKPPDDDADADGPTAA
jgi:hypothetical protein